MKRFDTGDFRSPVKTPNGYLRCDARITRIGVFPYRLANNKIRNELRIPDEVFKSDSMVSFEDVPLTNEHPREKLTTKNTRRFQAGNIKRVREDAKFVAADVLITDEDAIVDAEAGKTQLSCGYTCDLDFTPGVTNGIKGVQDGLHYDAIQRNIVGNHVAIVAKGRAGAESMLHLDEDDAVMVTESTHKDKPAGTKTKTDGEDKMKIKIDGVDYDFETQAGQAVSKLMARADQHSEKVTALETSVSTEKARADKAEEDLATEKKAHKADSSDEAVQKAVEKRVALETSATGILKDDSLKISEMSADEIKKAVVLKVSPGAKEKLDTGDEAYLDARYDAAVEGWLEEENKKPSASDGIRTSLKKDSTSHTDAMAARDRMIAHNAKLGTDPIGATAANS